MTNKLTLKSLGSSYLNSVVCGAEAIFNSVQRYSEHHYNIRLIITIEDQAIMYFLDNPWQQLQNGCMSKDFCAQLSVSSLSQQRARDRIACD